MIKNIKKLYIDTLRLISWDITTLLLFELGYKFLLLILVPLAKDLLLYAVRRTGSPYLTVENLTKVITNPFSALLLIFLLFLLAFYIFIELAAIVLYLEQGKTGRHMGVFTLFRKAVRKALLVFRPKNTAVLLYVLLFIPLAGPILFGGPVSSLKIPEFILEYIHGNQMLAIIYYTAAAAMTLISFQWIFSIPDMLIRDTSFPEAIHLSRRIQKKKSVRTLAVFLSWFLVTVIFFVIVYYACVIFTLLFIRLTTGNNEPQGTLWSYFYIFNTRAAVTASTLSVICNLGLITSLYHRYRGEAILPGRKNISKIKYTARFLTHVVLLYVLLVLYAENIVYPGYYTELTPSVRIIAHRAGSMFAPENTLSALNEAVKSGASYAEIDVQQTKDGVLVVMHDTSLKRTTGVNKQIWTVTYDEMKDYDTGRYYSSDYIGETIPTLEQMLSAADNRIGLMIELKKNGHESDYVQSVINAIRKYNMENQCLIASMDYRLLEEARLLAPDIKTAYIQALAYGDLDSLNAADVLCIEASFVTQEQVARAKTLNKPIYAWTVNQERSMRTMVELQVDGLITDNPYLADYVLKTMRYNGLLGNLIDQILGV